MEPLATTTSMKSVPAVEAFGDTCITAGFELVTRTVTPPCWLAPKLAPELRWRPAPTVVLLAVISHPIQRCRNHKLRNVLGHLPKDQHPQVKAAFRAAMKLDAKQGEQKLEQLARWLERDHPSASASLREGLSEMFTINRLGLPPRLRKCSHQGARANGSDSEANRGGSRGV